MRMHFLVCCLTLCCLGTLLQAALPTITSFTPTSGPVGTVVTITGTNLSGALQVTVNGTIAIVLSENTATSLKATVPAGASSGRIAVSTSGGKATSASNFTVSQFRPDLYLRPSTVATYTGVGIYSPDGASQTVGQSVANAKKASYYVTIKNSGNVADSFTITGSAAPADWTVAYNVGSTVVTAAVTSTGWTSAVIKPGATVLVTVAVTPAATLLGGPMVSQTITVTSNGDSAKTDVGVLQTTLPVLHRPDLYLRPSTVTSYSGVNLYTLDGTKQTVGQSVTNGVKATYYVTLRNNGNVPETFTLTGTKLAGWTVSYALGSTVITSAVTTTGWSTPVLNPGATTLITVTVTPGSSIAGGVIFTQMVTLTSSADTVLQDVGVINTTVPVAYHPDLYVRTFSSPTYFGIGVYNLDGNNQTAHQAVVNGVTTSYIIIVKNNGNMADSFKISALPAPPGWTISYYLGSGADITSTLTASGWTTALLNPGASVNITVYVTPGAIVPGGSVATRKVMVTSTTDVTKQDVVVMATTATIQYRPDLSARPATMSSYTGVGVYNLDGATQTVGQPIAKTVKATYYLHVQNNGNLPDTFTITGTAAPVGWTVEYKDSTAGTTITSAITGTGWLTPMLSPGSVATLAVYVTPGATLGADAVATLTVTGVSNTSTTQKDVVVLQTIILGLPTLTSFTPSSSGPGVVVTLTGTKLWGASAVKFNGVAASAFNIVSATTITVTVPAGASSGQISVTTPGGTATSATDFTFIPAPIITDFTPHTGPIGQVVTLIGMNFTGATKVKFGSTSGTNMTVQSDTAISVTVPQYSSSGKITVTTPGGACSSTTDFIVIQAPNISNFTPSKGPVGVTVVLSGSYFTGATSVTFNGITALFTVVSSSSISTTVPVGATTGPVVVTTPGGSDEVPYIVLSAPTITSFTPTIGNTGTVVTITGTNLSYVTAVTFNGLAATAVNGKNATTILATAPSGVSSGKIAVTTMGGTVTSSADFIVVPPPTITNFTPTAGAYKTEVTLTGMHLTDVTSVTVNGEVATRVTILSDTVLTFIVPSGASTGKISVTGPGGTTFSNDDITISIVTGSTRINPKDQAVMVWVSGATFTMGTDYGTSEYPTTQQVTLSGYWIYKYEVTVAQYRQFCSETGNIMPPAPNIYLHDYSWIHNWGGLDRHPIVDVSWAGAKAYAEWAGVSMTTEAQWEYAARGPEGYNFPWPCLALPTNPWYGWDATKYANYYNSENVEISTWPVGSFPDDSSWCGVMDMAGNVAEWCVDWYDKYSNSPVTDPTGPTFGTNRIVRGGCWRSKDGDGRGADRGTTTPEYYTEITGFRCGTSVP